MSNLKIKSKEVFNVPELNWDSHDYDSHGNKTHHFRGFDIEAESENYVAVFSIEATEDEEIRSSTHLQPEEKSYSNYRIEWLILDFFDHEGQIVEDENIKEALGDCLERDIVIS